ncbi:unnamed protein product [Knipowitschia caucasica]|uniref:DRBM domain-containing protein n=1 Tax=Knipowitschia caucasica TaxID=637954 RepID=A0AAV2MF01_KNICA
MKGIPPKYTIVDVDKQSNPWIFYVQVTVADVPAVGLGLDKKDAKRNAASKVLNTFGYNFVVKEPEPRPKEDITSQQIETDVLEEVPKDDKPQQDQECSVAQGDSIQSVETQSPTEDTSVDTSAAAQDEAAEVFLDAVVEEVQTPPEEIVFVESPEDTATDVVDQAELLRDQEQSPVLTQTVSEEVTICDVPRDASTTPEMETDVHDEVDESQQDQECAVVEDNFFQTEEIQSPTDDTSVLSSAAAQDEAAEGFLDNIEEEVQTPPDEFVYLETCEDTSNDAVELAALLDAIEEEVQTPPEDFVFVETPEDTATDVVDQAELLRDQEQSPVLTQTVSEEVMICDVPQDATPEMDGWTQANTTQGTKTDVHEKVDESQQDQEHSVAEDDFFQTEKIQTPTDDTTVLSSAAAQDEAAEVFLDDIEEEVQTPPKEFVYLETCEDTSADGADQAALLSDQEQSPEVSQTENKEETVHKVLDQSDDDNTTNFEETDVNGPTSPLEDLTSLRTQETVVTDTVSATSQPEIITEDISESLESSSSTDTSTEPSRISPTVLKGSFFITCALTQKLFKLAGSKDHRNASLMGARLHYSIKQQLELDEICQIKLKNLEKVGKAAAKRLSAEYGSADAVLRAAREDDTAAFEAAAAKHINAELRSFQKRPKSALSRLFSRLRRAFTF